MKVRGAGVYFGHISSGFYRDLLNWSNGAVNYCDKYALLLFDFSNFAT